MSDRPPEVVGAIRLGRKTLDALAYAVLLTAAVAGTSAFFELSGEGTLFRTKYVLFWVGFALLAVGLGGMELATAAPNKEFVTSGDDRQKRASGSVGARTPTRLERVAAWLPPMRWVEVNPDDRFSTYTKQFLAAVLMLALSITMEFVFGIASPGTV